jgi:hypothetical protein
MDQREKDPETFWTPTACLAPLFFADEISELPGTWYGQKWAILLELFDLKLTATDSPLLVYVRREVFT